MGDAIMFATFILGGGVGRSNSTENNLKLNSTSEVTLIRLHNIYVNT
jgi:hypothetical protein